MINNYIINEQDDNIPYPFMALSYNSNSWAQSLIKAAGGTVEQNFKGFDVSNSLRIPLINFQSMCPKSSRPRINQ